MQLSIYIIECFGCLNHVRQFGINRCGIYQLAVVEV